MIVLDFSQFLSGPYAGLRLADLGARVIKIEKNDSGDICRSLYISNLELDGDSTLFHSINRNKESFSANLKNEDDYHAVAELVKKADVVIQNYRPGVIEKLGFSYEEVKKLNPNIIYGSISGYGSDGPLIEKPGQDLLVQSFTGIPWSITSDRKKPTPYGLAIADMITGAHLAEGILASLVRGTITGKGAKVEVSLLESTLDLMQEIFRNVLQDYKKNYVLAPAPKGIYETKDGFIALEAESVPKLGKIMNCPKLMTFEERTSWVDFKDQIKQILQGHFVQKSSNDLINILEREGISCAEVFNWKQLIEHEGFQILEMVQNVYRSNGTKLTTLRCPIRIDGERFLSSIGSPKVGEHNESIRREFNF
ncbi:CoA transferase [Paenibacillus abyssi]|uniref:CoA transferase n=2 Tax=Paenibacillus abyssi TaxID=1340531 RepID=A0A917CYU9_9BACL|nr:CoA transferase [Paenibacillus abyssi]